MPSTPLVRGLLALGALLFTPAAAQTFTSCNPLKGSCPADPALGTTMSADFTAGASDQFTAQGSPSYDSNGASFTVAKSGDSPGLTSKWYIMFGRVEVVVKAAPGAGIVSSSVLQSDDLDEIDWEWLGADDANVQTNYFGKGLTLTYDRGQVNPNPGNQDGFHTYTIDWTAEQVVWSIDGTTVRVLTPATADANQYPQTPMQLKVGVWSAGDPANAPGTIQWSGGPTDYSKGPFTMQLKSLKVTDYSTGTEYKYGDQSGNWESIQAVGGAVNGGGSSVIASAIPPASSSAAVPPHTETSALTSSASSTPAKSATVSSHTSTSTSMSIPALPSGWTVSTTGRVIPPSSAPTTSHSAVSTGSSASSSGSSGGVSASSTLATAVIQQAGSSPSPSTTGTTTIQGNGSAPSVSGASWSLAAFLVSAAFFFAL